MDPRLHESILSNDISAFTNLVRENRGILEQRTVINSDTALHLASRFGSNKFVTEIVSLCPYMVAAENKKLETPIHEASRRGNDKVLSLLLEINPWVAGKVNCNNESALFVACSYGHINVVNLLLAQSWLLGLEEDRDDMTSIHVAASKGHANIVCRILEVCPNFALKIDKNGFSPLHCACDIGHLEIATMLLKVDKALAMQYNNNGYTPLHLAAINGSVAILEKFWLTVPTSFLLLTKEGDTVCHLTVRFSHDEAFKCLAEVFKDTNLFCQPDQFGNTILHLAISRRLYDLADYIITESTVEINHPNYRGHTVLDLLDQLESNSVIRSLKYLAKRAGGKKSSELPALIPCVATINPQSPELKRTPQLCPKDKLQLGAMDCSTGSELNNHPVENLPTSEAGIYSGSDSSQNQIEENSNIRELSQSGSKCFSKKTRSSSSNTHHHKHLSKRHRKKLIELYNRRNKKQHETHREGLQNARNTIVLVAILIATVTFSAGMSPPGGVYQDGPLRGKSAVGRTTAFKVFAISNHVALFTSICIVSVLVSIIPFRRKPLMKLLVIAHKAMWMALASTATAYSAGAWAVMPHDHRSDWALEAVVILCIIAEMSVFIVLGIALVKHRLEKSKYKNERMKRKKSAKMMETEGGIQEVKKKKKERKIETSSGLENQDTDAGIEIKNHDEYRKTETSSQLKNQDTGAGIHVNTQDSYRKAETNSRIKHENWETAGKMETYDPSYAQFEVETLSDSSNSDVGSAMSQGYHAY